MYVCSVCFPSEENRIMKREQNDLNRTTNSNNKKESSKSDLLLLDVLHQIQSKTISFDILANLKNEPLTLKK